MSFEENIKNHIDRIKSLRENISTEEATKTSLIMPFFQILGYDVFNPLEFVPEFVADVGIKKGEKVDYAICINSKPTVLIEAKSVNENLRKHDSQLFRYFGTTEAKFGILTNGIVYNFYTDLDEPNKMDSTPFFQIDLTDISEQEIQELKKFCKENFDLDKILNTAEELKYLNQIKIVLKEEFSTPSDDFIKFILNHDIYDGVKTQNVIDKYRPILKRSLTQYLNDLVNDRIQNALLGNTETLEKEVIETLEDDETVEDGIETTEEELQAYYIVKSILGKTIPLERIVYKDTRSYFSIIIDGKVTKWICRVYLKEHVKFVIIVNGDTSEKYTINSVDDIYQLSSLLIKRTQDLIK